MIYKNEFCTRMGEDVVNFVFRQPDVDCGYYGTRANSALECVYAMRIAIRGIGECYLQSWGFSRDEGHEVNSHGRTHQLGARTAILSPGWMPACRRPYAKFCTRWALFSKGISSWTHCLVTCQHTKWNTYSRRETAHRGERGQLSRGKSVLHARGTQGDS